MDALAAPAKYSPEEAALLRRHVSNLDKNVYVIYNLPQEVVAVIFAYVSRSPRSFRDNLLSLIRDREIDLTGLVDRYATEDYTAAATERARKFHERWVVNYGHASVAELASGVAVGVERISRLASARLELANPFLSFIEYSQRYQMPQPDWYFVPAELDAPGHGELRAAFTEVARRTYALYAEIHRRLVPYLRFNLERRPKETDKGFESRTERLSFEDARYALTLAVYTNLGMVGNARALRDAIVTLLSDPYPETTALAEAIRDEVLTVVPTLVRYADPSPYLQRTPGLLADAARALGARPAGAGVGAPGDPAAAGARIRAAGPEVRLLGYTGAQDGPSALDTLVRALLFGVTTASAAELDAALAGLGEAAKRAVVEDGLRYLGRHDHPLDAFKAVRYQVEFCVSEANWHQLLRHSRKIAFLPQEPGIEHGVTVPPALEAAGLAPLLWEAVETAERGYRRLAERLPWVAPYLVTNAHRRRVLADFDLWEAFHLVNLRGKPEAQWDIRATVHRLADLIHQVHPFVDLRRARYRPAEPEVG